MLEKLKKLFSILNPEQKKSLINLSLMLLVVVLIEFFSLSFLSAFLDLLNNNTDSIIFEKISNFIEKFNFDLSLINIFQICFLLLILTFGFKNLFTIFVNYKEGKFVNEMKKWASINLYKNYLNKDYKYFFNTKLEDISRNLTIEINHFSNGISSIIKILINFSIFSSIFTFLFLHNFYITLNLFLLFSIFGLTFFYFNNKEISKLGKERPLLISQRLKIVNETFSNIKFLKLKTNNLFLINFIKTNTMIAFNGFKTVFINTLARPIFEIFVLLVLFFTFIIATNNSLNFSILTSNLVLYIVAGYRAMPALNNLIINLQNLQYNLQGIDLISSIFINNTKIEKQLIKKSDYKANIVFKNKIEFKNVSFFYDKKEEILNNLNLTINKNEHVGLIGESGSGKTTLSDLIIGLIKPTSGKIYIDSEELKDEKVLDWQKNIGFVPQNIFLDNSTIIENIAYGVKKENINIKRVREVVKQSNLNSFLNTVEDDIYSRVGENGILLSGGQKQRLGIARALYTNPDILIFDEATSSLDEITELEILKEINLLKKAKTLITISHNNKIKNFCDKTYIINRGKIQNT